MVAIHHAQVLAAVVVHILKQDPELELVQIQPGDSFSKSHPRGYFTGKSYYKDNTIYLGVYKDPDVKIFALLYVFAQLQSSDNEWSDKVSDFQKLVKCWDFALGCGSEVFNLPVTKPVQLYVSKTLQNSWSLLSD